MSEFTFGLLYRHDDAERLDSLLDELGFIQDHDALNDAWQVATLDMDAVAMLLEPEAPDWPEEVRQMKKVTLGPLQALSQTAPVLFFYNAVDHGWGYRLCRDGAQTASFDFSYEDDRPDAPIPLAACHPEQFACFGVAPEALQQLNALLDESTLRQSLADGTYFDLVERFKRILGIEEMTWIP
jgi:hypothetical protein